MIDKTGKGHKLPQVYLLNCYKHLEKTRNVYRIYVEFDTQFSIIFRQCKI